jgi:hypothetical protein
MTLQVADRRRPPRSALRVAVRWPVMPLAAGANDVGTGNSVVLCTNKATCGLQYCHDISAIAHRRLRYAIADTWGSPEVCDRCAGSARLVGPPD